jgi:hypothetical protein
MLRRDPINPIDPAVLTKLETFDTPPREPLTVTSGSQLFVDDYLVHRMTGVQRRLNRPRKESTPVLTRDRLWEISGLVYGRVLEQEEELWLYYIALGRQGIPNKDHLQRYGFGKCPVCLAVSTDGVNWEKRPVAHSPVAGGNIVLDDILDDFSIVRDEQDPDPQRRYKMLTSRGEWMKGLSTAVSADGLQWQFVQEFAVPYLGDRMCYWWDPVRQKHVAWSRDYHAHPKRLIWQVETEDFDRWDDCRENHPWLALAPDRDDHEEILFYGGYPFWYESLYLAYLEVYYPHLQRLDTQLCASRDGRNWMRVGEREPFLRNGEHGEFDAYWIVPTFNPPILRDGRLLIHYNGRPDPHITPGFKHLNPGMGGAYGLATLREDGFVSLDATGAEGVVETHLLSAPQGASRILVNVCPFDPHRPETPMQVVVEVLDEAGQAQAAWRIEQNEDTSQVWHQLEADRELPYPLRLRFRMVNARLYAFRIEV